WWRHYGQNRSLRIFAFRSEGRLVGLAPMFVETFGFGPTRLKLAKRVGADFALTTFSLPLEQDFAESAFRDVISYLLERDRCDAIWFGPMPETDLTTKHLRAACRSLEQQVEVLRDASPGVHTVFDLPENFDSYLSKLTKNTRQNYRRNINLIK